MSTGVRYFRFSFPVQSTGVAGVWDGKGKGREGIEYIKVVSVYRCKGVDYSLMGWMWAGCGLDAGWMRAA